ncbi:unnamed protein product [Cyprideis torosa]|uniref:Uncharacterized protein n=1 Tax=Cyprideis torosa TaxID=163714 RepID=A0A7R8W3S2_9CRUS|nr:unnamed protein product [Cyprideis torosa]CAG0882421.1 unnamed protein product [Cyprideis torosa]
MVSCWLLKGTSKSNSQEASRLRQPMPESESRLFQATQTPELYHGVPGDWDSDSDADSERLGMISTMEFQKHFGSLSLTGGPREVSVSMYILNMHPVDDADMHLTLQMYLRAQWKEPRLNVSWEGKNPGDAYLHIPPQRFDELPWHPDLFIVNGISIESPKLFTDPIFIRVMGDNETILVSRLIVVKIPCTMDFRDYPLDEQRCSISLESCGFSTNLALVLFSSLQNFRTVTTQEWSYGGLDLAADIGGYVGALLGISLLSVSYMIIHRLRRMLEKQDEK